MVVVADSDSGGGDNDNDGSGAEVMVMMDSGGGGGVIGGGGDDNRHNYNDEYNKDNYVLCRVKRKRGKDDNPIVPKETIEVEELNDIIGSNDAAPWVVVVEDE
ncbi:hypothetical protein FXO38_24804 [Capsicum annuum]|nr:hypothetical protein FXO38_24804 [Capsicum annuum]KAF3662276.1 hypothetical protein FXO37_12548 [Capsicum annuum]